MDTKPEHNGASSTLIKAIRIFLEKELPETEYLGIKNYISNDIASPLTNLEEVAKSIQQMMIELKQKFPAPKLGSEYKSKWEHISRAFNDVATLLESKDRQLSNHYHESGLMLWDKIHEINNPIIDSHTFKLIAPEGIEEPRRVIKFESGQIGIEYDPHSPLNTQQGFVPHNWTFTAIERAYLDNILRDKPEVVNAWKQVNSIDFDFQGNVNCIYIAYGLLPGTQQKYKQTGEGNWLETIEKIALKDSPTSYKKERIVNSLSDLAIELRDSVNKVDLRTHLKKNIACWLENSRNILHEEVVFCYLGRKETYAILNEALNEGKCTSTREEVISKFSLALDNKERTVTLERLINDEVRQKGISDLPESIPTQPLSSEIKK